MSDTPRRFALAVIAPQALGTAASLPVLGRFRIEGVWPFSVTPVVRPETIPSNDFGFAWGPAVIPPDQRMFEGLGTIAGRWLLLGLLTLAITCDADQGPVGRLGPDPLIVIDGVVQPPGTTVDQIDRRNIESIEITKGDAGRVLYGYRAAEGVISITTKAAGGLSDAEPPPPPPLTAVRERRLEPTDAMPVEPTDPVPPKPDALSETAPTFGFEMEADRPALIAEPAGDADAWELSELAETLVVIDGVVQADLAAVRALARGDIDSIEVLTGVAAVEAYGPRGARGVIRITTNKR